MAEQLSDVAFLALMLLRMEERVTRPQQHDEARTPIFVEHEKQRLMQTAATDCAPADSLFGYSFAEYRGMVKTLAFAGVITERTKDTANRRIDSWEERVIAAKG